MANVKKEEINLEVLESCRKMVNDKIAGIHAFMNLNKSNINRLAKEQRRFKAQIGVLYQMKKDLNPKKV